MSINSQLTATTVTFYGNGCTVGMPDPAAYYPEPVKTALDRYLAAAKEERLSAAAADPEKADQLEAACVETWNGLLAALNEHESQTRARAAAGRRDAAKQLRELLDAIEDAACDYVANTLIEQNPTRAEIPDAWRSKVPGFIQLNLGLDGNGDIGGLRQALDAIHDG